MANNPMYNAILKWSLSQHDGTSSAADVGEMSQEKRDFLDNAMKSMVEDETKTMQELVEALKAPEDTPAQIESKQQALEDLIDRSDRLDYAIALHSFGNGLFPTIALLETSKDEGVRCNAAELVALCVQNNPAGQAWAFEGGALEKLLNLHKCGGEKEKQKCLLALSGLIANNAPAQEAFLQAGGLSALEEDIKAEVGRRLKVKALFTVAWIMDQSSAARGKVVSETKVAALLAECAAEEDEELSNLAMTALLPLLKENKAATLAALQEAKPSLAAAVKKRAEAKDGDDVDEEAVAVAKALHALLLK
eukprot:CAMPEP_0181317678 /NCGR_PEP_ID=MMETSP1101-20121128/16600_1 /TAXON_ID=46948 /ORGANISM="Rhodomonas abbreviata, Strain Caron Lab Isolate" /LENGTH=306 /DNA_ID=CAMNT_0023425095 /DNA_START=79 /DNA_END=999 /DNA_ORIENTATION=+